MQECKDHDTLLLLPVCQHMRAAARPLVLDVTTSQVCAVWQALQEDRIPFKTEAKDVIMRLAMLGIEVANNFRKDKEIMEAIKNV